MKKCLTSLSHLMFAWFTQVTIANYLKMIQEGVDGFAHGTLGENQVIPHVAIHNGKVWR